ELLHTAPKDVFPAVNRQVRVCLLELLTKFRSIPLAQARDRIDESCLGRRPIVQLLDRVGHILDELRFWPFHRHVADSELSDMLDVDSSAFGHGGYNPPLPDLRSKLLE